MDKHLILKYISNNWRAKLFDASIEFDEFRKTLPYECLRRFYIDDLLEVYNELCDDLLSIERDIEEQSSLLLKDLQVFIKKRKSINCDEWKDLKKRYADISKLVSESGNYYKLNWSITMLTWKPATLIIDYELEQKKLKTGLVNDSRTYEKKETKSAGCALKK